MNQYQFDFETIELMRDADGATWAEVADLYGCDESTVRKWYNAQPGTGPSTDAPKASSPVGLFTEQQRRVQGGVDLNNVHETFGVDPEIMVPRNVSTKLWEQQVKGGGFDVFGSISATFQYNPVREARIAERIMEKAVEDMRTHVPIYDRVLTAQHPPVLEVDSSVLWTESINDAHIGMLAWRHETGKDDYDLNIAVRDYDAVSQRLVRMGRLYAPHEVLIVLGNDMQHIDTLLNKQGASTKGTPQDFDSRLAKIKTAVRRAAVDQIDRALTYCPTVTVAVIPGNHDRHSMYNVAEVLYAWYRNVNEVTILNAPSEEQYAFPRLRQFYQFGNTGLMLTHGEGFNRNREPLPLVFADEAPHVWAATTYREVLCGHWHKTQEKGYARPTVNLDETRSVRIRALPGLTAVDGWHDDQAYSHWRAATGIAYKASGGVAGLHEVEP